MSHPNEQTLRKAYEAFDAGDFDVMASLLAEDHVVHMPGDNLVSGDHEGKQDALALFGRMAELTDGTFGNDEIHGIVANDDEGTVLVSSSAQRDGETLEATEAHVLRFRDDGQIVEFWTHPDDQQAWDEFWS